MTAIIERLIERCSACALHWPRATIAAVGSLALLCGVYGVRTLAIDVDTENMISADLPWRRDFIDYADHFPMRARALVIVVDALTAAQAERFTRALAEMLRSEPALYADVFAQSADPVLDRAALLYLEIDELEALADALATAQPLLGSLRETFDGRAVIDLARRALESDNDVSRSAGALLVELARTVDALGSGGGAAFDWRALMAGDASISAATSGTRQLIVLTPWLDSTSTQPAGAAIAGIRAAAVALNATETVPVRVRLTGMAAMEHEELGSAGRSAVLGIIATLLLAVAVVRLALGSWRLLAATVAALAAGLAITAAFAAAAVGELNLLAVAFVVLNIGLGTDYSIHFSLRYQEIVNNGSAPREALPAAYRSAGAALALCAVTTAAGFYAFIPTDFDGIAQLGLIAGTGVLVSLLVNLTLLPALLLLLAPMRAGSTRSIVLAPRVVAPILRRPRVVLGLALLLALVGAGALPQIRFDGNPIHLRNPQTESVATLEELAANGEAPLLNVFAVAPDVATAARWGATLGRDPAVRRVVSLDSLVPREQAVKLEILEDIRLLMGPRFEVLARRPPSPDALHDALRGLAAQASGVAPEESELRRAASAFLARLDTVSPEQRAAALIELDRALTGDLPEELARLAQRLRATELDSAALPAVLYRRFVSPDGRALVEVVARENVDDNDAAQRFVAATRAVAVNATGLPVVYLEAGRTVVTAFAHALAYALLAVGIIVWIFMRRASQMLLVLAPIVVGSIVTAGAATGLGIAFNYANIIALPLLIGIGVDNAIHIVHRARHAGAATVALFASSTPRAVLASSLTTAVSFGALAFSSHLGTASMGKLLLLGLAVSLVATLIVLPAGLEFLGQRRPR